MLFFCFLTLLFCFFAFLQSVFTEIQISFAWLISWINSRSKRYHLFWLSHFWLCYDCFTHTFHFLVVLVDLLSTSWVKSQSIWKLRCKINSSHHFLCIEVSFIYLDLFLQSQWSFPWFFVCHLSKNSHNQKLKLSMASWCLDTLFENFTFEIHWKLHYLQPFNWNLMFLSSKLHSNQVVECIIFVWIQVKFQFWFIVPDCVLKSLLFLLFNPNVQFPFSKFILSMRNWIILIKIIMIIFSSVSSYDFWIVGFLISKSLIQHCLGQKLLIPCPPFLLLKFMTFNQYKNLFSFFTFTSNLGGLRCRYTNTYHILWIHIRWFMLGIFINSFKG